MPNDNFNRIVNNNKILKNNNEWFDNNVKFQSIFYNNIKRTSNSFHIKISENFVNIGNNIQHFVGDGDSVSIRAGSYGRVYAGTMYFSNRKLDIAVKVTNVNNDDEFNRQQQEALLSRRMGSLKIGPQIWDSFFYKQQDNNGDIVAYNVLTMERATKGDVRSYLENVNYSDDQKIDIINKSYAIIKLMLENNVFCYDVKPRNMVVGNNDVVRMIDFDPFFCDEGNTPVYKDLVTRTVTDPVFQKDITYLMIIIPFFIIITNIIRVYTQQHPNTQLNEMFRTTEIYTVVRQLCNQQRQGLVNSLRSIFGNCEDRYNCNLQNSEDFKVVKSFYWYINRNFDMSHYIENGNLRAVRFENGITTNEAFDDLMNQLCPT